MRARIRFEPSGRTVEVVCGTLLLDAARQAGLPLARACGAEGICGRCGLTVLEGAERLAPQSPLEARAKRRNRVSDAMRLACRITVESDLVVTAPYW
jgi:ferredoxin